MTAAPGPRYRLTARADLAVFYAADAARYAPAVLGQVGLERFCQFFAACPSRGFACDGQAIGGLIFDGSQAHIAVLPEHHGRWAHLLAPALQWLFALQPQMLVAVEKQNAASLAFMARNGWPEVPGPAPAGMAVFRVSARPERWHGRRLARLRVGDFASCEPASDPHPPRAG